MRSSRMVVGVVVALLAACSPPVPQPMTGGGAGGGAMGGGAGGGQGEDAGLDADAGDPDAGAMDAGDADGGVTDGGATDAGGTDGGETDGGDADGGQLDAGALDAGDVDAGGLDAGLPDAGMNDAGVLGAPCVITPGDGNLVLTGTLLTPTGPLPNGQLRVDTAGLITCVGTSCVSGGETRIDCPAGVISPGLINAHEHLNFAQNAPFADTGERYEQRHDWRGGRRGHTDLTSAGNASVDQMRWAELRFLLGGATSIAGNDSVPGLLRNLDSTTDQGGLGQPPVAFATFPLDDSQGLQRAGDCNYGGAPVTAASIASLPAWTGHAGEGIDAVAANEVSCMTSSTFDVLAPGVSNDLLAPQTSLVSGIAITADGFRLMAAAGTGLVWTPRSDLRLYGDTARVSVAARLGIDIALATEWAPSGSTNLLRELACADSYNRLYQGGVLTDAQLWAMVTINPARLTATDDVIGALAPGRQADIAIFDARVNAGYRAVVAAEPKDVLLVLRGGKPLFGAATLLQGLGVTGCDALDVCGEAKRVCLSSEIGQTLAQLQAAVGVTQPFSCGAPAGEPTCTPSRTLSAASVNGSTRYDGGLSSADLDGDGVENAMDDCPTAFNPVRPSGNGAQDDADGDGLGDLCDPCPLLANGTTCPPPSPTDRDADGIANATDNCPDTSNTNQVDADMDGKGDACDACPQSPNPGAQGCPVTIYQLKNGTIPPGTDVRVVNALVTAKWAQGFVLQVKAGDVGYLGADSSGLFVSTSDAQYLASAVVGTRVTVEGRLANYFGQLRLMPVGSVTSTSMTSEAPPSPVSVTVLDVGPGGTRSAALDGVVVSLPAVIVSAVDQGSGEITVSDSVDSITLGTLLYRFQTLPPVGATVASVTGIASTLQGQVLPREASDVGLPVTGLASFSPGSSFLLEGSSMTVPMPLTVTLTQATTVDTFVSVTSDPPSCVVAGGGVTVPAGQTSAIVSLTCSGSVTALLTATLDGAAATAQVRPVPASEPRLVSSVTPSSSAVVTGATVELTVVLNVPATTGGASVSLGSSSPGVTVPATVTVPEGERSASFSVIASASTTITATLGASSASATITTGVTANHLVINEVDYDQMGTNDAASFIEIFNPTSTAVNLTNYAVVLVNGSNSTEYARFALSAAGSSLPAGGYLVIRNSTVTIPSGVLSITATGDFIQNGPIDGIALVEGGTVIDALSYEGSITAAVITGVSGTTNLVEGSAFSGADSNTDPAVSLIRRPNGNDSGNAATDWALGSQLTPGASN